MELLGCSTTHQEAVAAANTQSTMTRAVITLPSCTFRLSGLPRGWDLDRRVLPRLLRERERERACNTHTLSKQSKKGPTMLQVPLRVPKKTTYITKQMYLLIYLTNTVFIVAASTAYCKNANAKSHEHPRRAYGRVKASTSNPRAQGVVDCVGKPCVR